MPHWSFAERDGEAADAKPGIPPTEEDEEERTLRYVDLHTPPGSARPAQVKTAPEEVAVDEDGVDTAQEELDLDEEANSA